jgi:hypothetical protein
MKIELITQAEFEVLWNIRRKELHPVGFYKVSFPLMTTKVIKKSERIFTKQMKMECLRWWSEYRAYQRRHLTPITSMPYVRRFGSIIPGMY